MTTMGGTITGIRRSGYDGWLMLTVEHGKSQPDTTLPIPADHAREYVVGQAVVLHLGSTIDLLTESLVPGEARR